MQSIDCSKHAHQTFVFAIIAIQKNTVLPENSLSLFYRSPFFEVTVLCLPLFGIDKNEDGFRKRNHRYVENNDYYNLLYTFLFFVNGRTKVYSQQYERMEDTYNFQLFDKRTNHFFIQLLKSFLNVCLFLMFACIITCSRSNTWFSLVLNGC